MITRVNSVNERFIAINGTLSGDRHIFLSQRIDKGMERASCIFTVQERRQAGFMGCDFTIVAQRVLIFYVAAGFPDSARLQRYLHIGFQQHISGRICPAAGEEDYASSLFCTRIDCFLNDRGIFCLSIAHCTVF